VPRLCSKEGAWKLVDFENWAWAGQPADVAYALRYTSPEVGTVVGGVARGVTLDCY
jgi:hypothetical protein